MEVRQVEVALWPILGMELLSIMLISYAVHVEPLGASGIAAPLENFPGNTAVT